MTAPPDGSVPGSISPELRFAFLFPPGAPVAWGEPSAQGGPLHRLVGWLGAVAQGLLVNERGIDDHVAAAYRKLLRDPSLAASAHFLEALVSGRKVRVADLLGVVPAESPRAQQLAEELRDLLRAVAAEMQESLEPPPAADGEGARRLTAAHLLLDFLLENCEGELIRAAASGPVALTAASRPGPAPEAGDASFVRRRDDTRQPLHPFVMPELEGAQGPWMAWDFEGGHLRYLRTDGGDLREAPARLLPDFWLEFLLKMGAYGEVREWLKALPPGVRESLNHRNVLHAGSCHYGALYLRQREHQQATVELQKAVKVRPDLVLPHLYLAQAWLALKQPDRALEILRRHAVHFNRSDRIFELMGDCARQRRDDATALRLYEKAAGLNPFNRQVERKRDLLRDEARKEREQKTAAVQAGAQGAAGATAPVRLEEFVVDMTAEADLGAYSPTVGREAEIRQLVEVLSCRDKRNPLLLGEPGVGKTALVEDFVLRLVHGRLPARFHGRKVYLLSVATLLAGAKYRGQFEERVLEVVKLLKAQDCIVFIDNVHALVNAGLTRGGTLDTSSLLKPFLLRGEIQVIGATTHDEYRTNLEKDTALVRCFQVIPLEAPDADGATEMVLAVRGRYEAHHRVVLPESVVRATMPLIDSCVRERALPDKALDVYDRACAVASIRRSEGGPDEAGRTLTLDADDVLAVLSEMTRIPVARLSEDARTRYADMEELLARRVVGQPEAVARVSRVLRAARTGLTLDARRPKGVFLFVGPTGVGKTELARAMAELLFGSHEHLVRIDMSEYMERINQSRLIGTAPGYVGYNDENQLTDAVRRSPHSLVLLDEIEKASHDLLNLFLQVFDAGRLTDGKGRTVHFDHATIVMTSNVGTHLFTRSALGFEEGRGGRANVSSSDLLREVRRHFPPEFLNRIDEIICFAPLSPEDVQGIARQKVASLTRSLRSRGRSLELSEAAEELLATEGYSADEGARNLERTIRRLLLEPLAERALDPTWERTTCVRVDADGQALTFELLEPEEEPDAVGLTDGTVLEEAPERPGP